MANHKQTQNQTLIKIRFLYKMHIHPFIFTIRSNLHNQNIVRTSTGATNELRMIKEFANANKMATSSHAGHGQESLVPVFIKEVESLKLQLRNLYTYTKTLAFTEHLEGD